MDEHKLTLSIIIPSFNESRTIREVIGKVSSVKYPFNYEIIVIDDASIDKTYEKELLIKLKEKHGNIKLFRNRVNKGKGACVRQAVKHARGEITIIQDADLEYNPDDIPKLIQPIINGNADAVLGSRFLESRWPKGMALPNFVGNKLLTFFTNILFGLKLTDESTCYKAVKTSLFKEMRLRTNRFAIEPEIVSNLAKKNARIIELPISYRGRTHKEGKKIKAKDFFYAIITLLYNKFKKD